MVRVADIRRGWGRFYDKSCKAKAQARQGHRRVNQAVEDISLGYDIFDPDDNEHPFSTEALGQW